MPKKVCASCGDRFDTNQTVELDGVSEEFAEAFFEKWAEEKMCSDCIFEVEFINETMKQDRRIIL